jgi:diguanylate cyclase (GGDEF)-like protein
VLRDVPFGWYATSMFSLVGLTLIETRGLGAVSPKATHLGEGVTLALYYIALTGFCRSFLTLARFRRLLDALTLPVLFANVVLIFVENMTSMRAYGFVLTEAFQAALLVLLFVRGVIARQEGFTPARFYLVAFGFAGAGILIYDLNFHGVLFPHQNLTRAFDAGLSLEALLLALALADRNRALSALISLDGLTGIANRRSFDGAMSRAWDRSRRSHTALGVLMIDVDHFKRYNDTHGHQAGDEILRRVAQGVQGAVLRPDDVAARYGGEEFAIVLPLAEGEASRVVGERVRQNVRALAIPYPEAPTGIITVSVGVASTRPAESGVTPAELLASADSALYQAKREGRDRVILAPLDRSTPDPAVR